MSLDDFIKIYKEWMDLDYPIMGYKDVITTIYMYLAHVDYEDARSAIYRLDKELEKQV